jgi:hypothetical protein
MAQDFAQIGQEEPGILVADPGTAWRDAPPDNRRDGAATILIHR